MKSFRHLPSFAFARVQTKPDLKRPEARLSMGYGFIVFKDAEGAKKVLSSLQGFVLDGHQLYVKFAGQGAEESKGKASVKGGNRTTKKDMQTLFGSHGHLKVGSSSQEVRLSHSWICVFGLRLQSRSGEHVCCAAAHAFVREALGTRVGGGGEQDIDTLRKKAGVGDGKLMPERKRKVDMWKTGEDVEDLEV
ncbi:hypothetical protein C0991_003181 [Blastosporella zonata]|nr:hypothetical protein C0991_003181 [Blastosporella zonata]